jgi:hypothetical protein
VVVNRLALSVVKAGEETRNRRGRHQVFSEESINSWRRSNLLIKRRRQDIGSIVEQ